jgi:toxin ParE1/3/4
MKELVFSPRARSDLDEIWDFTAERWDEEQADSYLRRIFAACEDLARGARISRSAEGVRSGYRKYAVESHVVYFQESDSILNVIRILHQQMDVPRHFRD